MSKFTVLMPLYNAEPFISESIESVLMQKTDFKYELIIIDDGSTDKSYLIANSYKERFPDIIRIVKNESNIGLLHTIIKGYELIKTEYFCVLDPDDYYIDDKKFQKAISFLEKNSDYTIYADNNYKLDVKRNKKTVFIDGKKDGISSTFDDYIHGKSVLGCTLGSTYRNVYFKEGVPAKLYEAIETCSFDGSFRGDAFRNILHLFYGKAYFKNDLASVYRYTGTGMWSSTSKVTKLLNKALFFYDNSVFFANKYLIYKSYKAFKKFQFTYEVENLLSLNVDREGLDVYKGESLLIIKKLLSAYAENKELIDELSNKSRKSLKNKFYFYAWNILGRKLKSKGLF